MKRRTSTPLAKCIKKAPCSSDLRWNYESSSKILLNVEVSSIIYNAYVATQLHFHINFSSSFVTFLLWLRNLTRLKYDIDYVCFTARLLFPMNRILENSTSCSKQERNAGSDQLNVIILMASIHLFFYLHWSLRVLSINLLFYCQVIFGSMFIDALLFEFITNWVVTVTHRLDNTIRYKGEVTFCGWVNEVELKSYKAVKILLELIFMKVLRSAFLLQSNKWADIRTVNGFDSK